MPAPAWEDLDDFLQLDDFAVEGIVKAGGTGTPRTIVGIFDDPYLNAQLGEYELDSSAPRFTVKETEAAGILRGDTLEVAGKVFDVLSSPQQDGTGMAVIALGRRHA